MTRTRLCRLPELSSAGRAESLRVPFFSARLGLRRWLAVYLTDGFQPKRGAAVAYLFRGHHSEWINPEEDPSRTQILPDRVNLEVTNGALPPMALIVPCLGSQDRRFHTVAADWCERARAPCVPGMGLGRYESHLTLEVFPRMEEALGVEDPLRVAIGFSLGGLVAFQLGLRHPGLFSHLAAYDPSFFRDPIDRADAILSHSMFDPVFGKPRNSSAVKAHSPIWLCRQLPAEHLRRTAFYLQSGPRASEPMDSNYERTRHFLETLESRGLHNHLPQVVTDGHHDWETADRFALRVLFRVFQADREGTITGNQKGEDELPNSRCG